MVDQLIEHVRDELEDIAAIDRQQEAAGEGAPTPAPAPPAVVVQPADDHVPELIDASIGEQIAEFRAEMVNRFELHDAQFNDLYARMSAIESPPEPELESTPEPIEPIEASPAPPTEAEPEPPPRRPRAAPDRSSFRHKFGSR